MPPAEESRRSARADSQKHENSQNKGIVKSVKSYEINGWEQDRVGTGH